MVGPYVVAVFLAPQLCRQYCVITTRIVIANHK